jgi:hypothetical protein
MSPINLVIGCCFYIIFIDDFSCFTWLYPMAYKSDVFKVFKKYKAFVENLFSWKIKQNQINNEGEFLSNEFKWFLSINDIYHQLTSPYSSP